MSKTKCHYSGHQTKAPTSSPESTVELILDSEVMEVTEDLPEDSGAWASSSLAVQAVRAAGGSVIVTERNAGNVMDGGIGGAEASTR